MKLTDKHLIVLTILHEHGMTKFSHDPDLTASRELVKTGHVEDLGGYVGITPKGLRYLNSH